MKIACISTYPPRECGIATFNQNLIQAISINLRKEGIKEEKFIIALNESEELNQYNYPPEVKFVIRQERQADYLDAAAYINGAGVNSCIIEHEFGIYGGDNGIYLLSLLHELCVPVVTVLHTVLREPTYIQKLITQEIARHSSQIVVMSKRAITFLTEIYKIPLEKIQLIEHGVPDLETPADNPVQKTYPFNKRKTLLTFGLISRNKGLETVIRALPKISARHPDVNYVILGNTHPGVVKYFGEEYRDYLKQLAKELAVEERVTFINEFVPEDKLIHYLTACDIYVTPYLNEAQITSGTLSYAIGAGAAVVSTPYWHAQELLDHNRGRLFNFKDFNSLADIVTELLDNESKLQKLKSNAYQYGLKLRWSNIGSQYLEIIKDLNTQNTGSLKVKSLDKDAIPIFSLAHIRRLTDSTGLIQHAKFGIPNLKEGYCLDDNARALILMLMSWQQFQNKEALELFPVYLSYIHYMQREDGYFRNFLSFNHNYLDQKGSEDSFGRTIWALGFLINSAPNNSYREFAEELFRCSETHFKDLKYLRGIANTLIGVAFYLKTHPSDERMMTEISRLTNLITTAFHKDKKDGWSWFEDEMTYDNAILPLALFHSAEITGDDGVKTIALDSLSFLEKTTMREGWFSPVGNDGWLHKARKKPVFDQQAIETMGMVLLYYQAYRLTQNPQMLQKLHSCYMWFHGNNTLRVPLYDPETNGCCDGLQPGKLNRNQGAESTLAYLISHLTLLKAIEEAPHEFKLKEKQSEHISKKVN